MRRRSFRGSSVLPMALIVTGAGIVATLIILKALGVLDLSRFGFGTPAVSHAGLVAVPTSVAAIPAYTKITRDHLWDPRARSLNVTYIRPEQIGPDICRGIETILGRVLDHDKGAGYVFTENDFLPRGTRPGLVAGIPAGMRAMRVDAEQVHGLYGLKAGDRFDLVATLPIDAARGAQGLNVGGIYGQQLALQARITNWMKQATVQVLVQNGRVVEPLVTRQVPISARTLTQGPITRTKPVQEIVIAVGPDEVARLTEAIAVGAQISCVPRSGRPDDPDDSVTPDLRPWSPFQGLGGPTASAPASSRHSNLAGSPSLTMIETLAGSKREIVAVPARPGETKREQ